MEKMLLIEEEMEKEDERFEDEDFIVSGLSDADYAFRKIKKLEEDLAGVKSYCDGEIDKYVSFYEHQKEVTEKQIEFYKFTIRTFLERQKEVDPKFKLNTASGSAHTTTRKTWNYQEDAVMEYLKHNNKLEFIKIKESLDKSGLKSKLQVQGHYAITEDGEVIPGIEITENTSLTIKLK